MGLDSEKYHSKEGFGFLGISQQDRNYTRSSEVFEWWRYIFLLLLLWAESMVHCTYRRILFLYNECRSILSSLSTNVRTFEQKHRACSIFGEWRVRWDLQVPKCACVFFSAGVDILRNCTCMNVFLHTLKFLRHWYWLHNCITHRIHVWYIFFGSLDGWFFMVN